MQKIDEGNIKFKLEWQPGAPPDAEVVREMVEWRDRLFQNHLIGAYANGVAYGNISQRLQGKQFIITGTQTGQIKRLQARSFTTVTDYNIANNRLTCRGPVKASSESLTHAMIYGLYEDVIAIFHVHDHNLWQQLQDEVPTSSPDVEYGTTAMAEEVKRLHEKEGLQEKKILVMAGHEDGILVFGTSMKDAASVLNNYLNFKL